MGKPDDQRGLSHVATVGLLVTHGRLPQHAGAAAESVFQVDSGPGRIQKL